MTAAQRYDFQLEIHGIPGGLMALSNLSREDSERIGMELRRARKRHFGARNSLNRAAEIAGVSIALLSMIERGQHPLSKVRPETLERFPEAYGLKAQEFSDLTGITLVRPNEVGGMVNAVANNLVEYVSIRINLKFSGTTVSVPPISHTVASVSEDLSHRELGGLVMDQEYIDGLRPGLYALWSDREASVGQLVVVEKDGAQYPAFLLEGGEVEVDRAVNKTTNLRFKPDKILGVIEEVRMLELPKRRLT